MLEQIFRKNFMREFKNVALAAIVALLPFVEAGAVSAADLGAGPYTKTPAYIVPSYSWSGAYVGFNVGYGWGRSSDTAVLVPSPFSDTANLTMNGIVGGGQIGFNVQMQNWVIGGEADFQGTNQKASHSFTCPAGVCQATLLGGILPVPGPAVSVTTTQQLNFFGTIRGRAGVAVVPEVLLYATGGLAYGQVDTDSNLAGAVRQQNYNPGWVVGAGVEGAFGGGWSVRLEYLYVDLGNVSGVFTSAVVAPSGTTTLVQGFNSHVTDNIVRVGVNYKFSGPDIAKY
jgi:outer membrane immunogenic protein